MRMETVQEMNVDCTDCRVLVFVGMILWADGEKKCRLDAFGVVMDSLEILLVGRSQRGFEIERETCSRL